eukprot:TRINITY_DN11262_c0_g1_i2.p1 TRINITY_DN11262_c0_g1~~TRINITY_DN11262_c0_g1_i2.p1  ORF type:complete len:263 (-),score=55.24 TRINITY_DN11262_c0_g1_i2:592-1380(-)
MCGSRAQLVRSDDAGTISGDRTKAEDADVLLFHPIDINWNDLPPKRAHQKWALYTWESASYYTAHTSIPGAGGWFKDPTRMALFDMVLSSRLDSTCPISPFDMLIDPVRVAESSPVWPKTKTTAPVVWIQSNCDTSSGREHYVRELQKHIRVDSYGKCLHNKDWDVDPSKQAKGDGVSQNDPGSTVETISQYKFYIAFENANCVDYVTERLVNAFHAGASAVCCTAQHGTGGADRRRPGGLLCVHAEQQVRLNVACVSALDP